MPNNNHTATKPVAALSQTDWLTDAADSEPGMELVVADEGTVERIRISAVSGDWLFLADGQSLPIQSVNVSRTMVVE